MSEPKPFTYQEQYAYYEALRQVAAALSRSPRSYKLLLTRIHAGLRTDPDYKELVASNFMPPEKQDAEKQMDAEALEALLDREDS
jgi:hypothetical protein